MTRYRNLFALIVLTAIMYALLFGYVARQFDNSPTVRLLLETL